MAGVDLAERNQAIRAGLAAGRTVDELAEEHGVSPGRIRSIASDAGPTKREPARLPAVYEMPADTALVPQHVRDSYVDPGALELIRKGMPENTWLAYRRQLIIFGDWCAKQKRTAAPVSQATMLSYLADLERLPMPGTVAHEEGQPRPRTRPAPSTVWIWYSAVKFVHGMGEPPLPWECGQKLSLALQGYENEMERLGWRPRSAPRAYPEDVRAMVTRCERDTSTGKRDAAILLLGWNTAARAADLTSYRIRDVLRTPGGLDLVLRRSKTLKPGQQRITAVFRNDDQPGYNPLYDPVAAGLEWIDWLAAHKEADPSWALFRPLDRWGTRLRATSRGPGYYMDSTSISNVVSKYALLAGLDETYTMHSLRRGYATWLKENGRDDLEIARAYGWSPGGSINVYLEEARRWSNRAPGKGMLL